MSRIKQLVPTDVDAFDELDYGLYEVFDFNEGMV